MKKQIKYVEYRRIGAALWQAQRAMSIAIEHFLRTEKLGLSQALALMALRDQPGLSGAALARHLLITAQSAGTLLEQLAAQGWIVRKPHAVHRAIWEAFLTEAGEEKLDRVNGIFDAFDVRMGEHLSAEERNHLFHLLRTCLETATEIMREED